MRGENTEDGDGGSAANGGRSAATNRSGGGGGREHVAHATTLVLSDMRGGGRAEDAEGRGYREI